MHDIDRTQFEFEPEDTMETGDFEFEPEDFPVQAESPFTEDEEIDLASQLLEITDEGEIDQFLGNLFRRAWKGIRKVAPSIVRPLGGILKGVVKKALPIAGGALGSMIAPGIGTAIGSKLASSAGSMFGLEIEGLSEEDQNFEVARRIVRLAGSAAQKAAALPPSARPDIDARRALIEAAKKHAPGIIRTTDMPSSPATSSWGKRGGRWMRRGNKIVLYGVY